MTIGELLYGLRDGRIADSSVRQVADDLSTDALSVDKGASYVESVIIGMPLLPLVFDGSVMPWKTIDGVKRLAALLAFANSKYKLGESSYSRLPKFQYFDDMSPFLRNRFMRAQIPCYIINPGTPKEIIDDIKKRIRTSF